MEVYLPYVIAMHNEIDHCGGGFDPLFFVRFSVKVPKICWISAYRISSHIAPTRIEPHLQGSRYPAGECELQI